MESNKVVLSVLAYNHPGVILRMSGLFSRRGFNIESMVAATTERENLSRLTIRMTGDKAVALQVVRQLLKLEDIVKVDILHPEACAQSELVLAKIEAPDPPRRVELLKTAQTYGCRVLDIGEHTVTLEVSGDSDEMDRFTEDMRRFGILEMARTGVTALERGDRTIHDGLGEK